MKELTDGDEADLYREGDLNNEEEDEVGSLFGVLNRNIADQPGDYVTGGQQHAGHEQT